MRKKMVIYLMLQYIVFTGIMKSEENITPQLKIAKFSNQEIVHRCWSVSSENQLYPFLQASLNRIEFLAPTGAVISWFNYLPHSQIVFSEHQQVIAFLEQPENKARDGLSAYKKNLSYRVTSKTGEKFYSIAMEINYDDPIPAILLAENGTSVLLDGRDGSAAVFSPAGEMQVKIDIFEDDEFAFEKPVTAALTAAGDVLVILAQKRPMTFDETKGEYISGEPWLIFYALDDRAEKWRQPLAQAAASTIAVSVTGKYIAVFSFTPAKEKTPNLMTTIFSKAGDQVLELAHSFHQAKFAEDKNSAFFVNRDELIIVNLAEKKYAAKNLTLDKKNRLISDLKIDPTNNFPVVLMTKSIFQNERFECVETLLLCFDHNFQKKWEIACPEEKYLQPSWELTSKEIGIGFLTNYKIFEVSRDR